MSTTLLSPASSIDASIELIPIVPAAVDVCAAICHGSFKHFNASVSLPTEYANVEEARDGINFYISQPTVFHLMAVRATSDSSVVNYVEGIGEVLGLVMMSCADEAGALGPLAVHMGSQSKGIGRALTQRCIDDAKQRGVKSVRLVGLVANITAFSLYQSLGFRQCEYAITVLGHVNAAQYKQLSAEMQSAGITVRPMERDDIDTCNQLHIASNSFSRIADLTHSFESQPSQAKATGESHSNGQQNGSTPAPTVGCWVAVRADGTIVGYCNGWTKFHHLSAHTHTHFTARHKCLRSCPAVTYPPSVSAMWLLCMTELLRVRVWLSTYTLQCQTICRSTTGRTLLHCT